MVKRELRKWLGPYSPWNRELFGATGSSTNHLLVGSLSFFCLHPVVSPKIALLSPPEIHCTEVLGICISRSCTWSRQVEADSAFRLCCVLRHLNMCFRRSPCWSAGLATTVFPTYDCMICSQSACFTGELKRIRYQDLLYERFCYVSMAAFRVDSGCP